MELFPNRIELRFLCVLEHQPSQLVILAIKQSQRHCFIHRHNFCVTERSWKPTAELVEGRLESFFCATAFVHHDGSGKDDPLVVRSPGPAGLGLSDSAWNQAGIATWFVGENLKLDAAFSTGFWIESPRGDELAPGG